MKRKGKKHCTLWFFGEQPQDVVYPLTLGSNTKYYQKVIYCITFIFLTPSFPPSFQFVTWGKLPHSSLKGGKLPQQEQQIVASVPFIFVIHRITFSDCFSLPPVRNTPYYFLSLLFCNTPYYLITNKNLLLYTIMEEQINTKPD